MSILIKGMKMPTSFEECQTVLGCCDAFEDGTVWCRLAHGYIGDERTVCPIVPVPPHGRLIDADDLHSVLRKRAKEFSNSEYGEGVKCGLADAREYIKIATTIIPASGGQEDE